ncbi:beta-galactosidase [Aquipluma nitroreducens]|uniref:Beta-galactosidase n=1 Tax=Aquipluma nitroreducens TaxID=2010828 RepID=A0A5K7SGB3_9BACT|nr:glycoside hydrolase family 2 TIM barrel-domain containing protein [Aquipluma nitroreducens]BBE20477.1 beta-galactosidase [Aquipluma nitroreducens]
MKLIYITFLLAFSCFLSFATPTQKQTLFLTGTDNTHTKTWEFFCTSGRNSGVWSKIEVPSHWEQQGFGEYDYGRDYRTYGKKFKFANEKGMYKYTFQVPADWKNRKVFIVFEGSMTDTEVKINGQLAGAIHQGAFYQFRYDITDKLKFGQFNLLEATVSKMSSDHSVNNAERFADYWVFGGIFRPVYLESFPEEHIERVAIDAKADGSFAMDVFTQNLKGSRTVSAEIIDSKNKVIATCNSIGKDSLVTLSCKVSNPELWTAETPNRYSVRVSLKNGKTELYSVTEKFGFRTIEIRQGDGIYLNGVKIKMKGINRHAFWPETGRCLNNQINLDDVKLIKSMNMNAVRCSHYPPDQSFLNYCDSLGLYVLDELAGWQNAYATAPGAKLVKELVIRDVNHPSIIFWVNGNEGGTNKELDDDFGFYDKSSRPVIHPHHKPGNDFNGIDCNHYENYYSSKRIFTEGKIYMPTEFLHSQDDGGGAAGLEDFWELFWNTPNAGGGFILALLDEGIVRTDLNGFIDVNRVNAPDGIVGPHREKEGSYYAIREIYCPVKIKLKELPEQFDGTIQVENRYHFTNLKDCRFEWQLVNFSTVIDRQAAHHVMKNGILASPDVKPLEYGLLDFGLRSSASILPSDYKKYDALYLKVFDPSGDEIYCYSWKIGGNLRAVSQLVKMDMSDQEKQQREKLKAAGIQEDNILPIEQQSADLSKEKGVAELIENDSLYTLKASGIAVTFSQKDGKIRKVTNDLGLPIPFSNGPVLVSGNAQLERINPIKGDKSYSLEMIYSGDLKKVIWTMFSSGWLAMDYEYQVFGEQMFTGVSFDFPESDVIGAKWLGKGPANVWKNRTAGGVLDVYQRMYNNKLPADNTWGLPQFKGYYPEVSWIEFNTVDGKFTVVAQDDDLFVRLFNFYGISGPRNYPVLPVGDISFLDAIPPIGTKLAMGISNDTWNLGPMGELNKMDKPVKRTLYFYFGLLN